MIYYFLTNYGVSLNQYDEMLSFFSSRWDRFVSNYEDRYLPRTSWYVYNSYNIYSRIWWQYEHLFLAMILTNHPLQLP